MIVAITKKQAEALFERFDLLVIDLNDNGWQYCIGDEGAPDCFAQSHSIDDLISQIKNKPS